MSWARQLVREDKTKSLSLKRTQEADYSGDDEDEQEDDDNDQE